MVSGDLPLSNNAQHTYVLEARQLITYQRKVIDIKDSIENKRTFELDQRIKNYAQSSI